MASRFPTPNRNKANFQDDIDENGYHIFSRKSAKITGFYPNKFPDYPGDKLKELAIGDLITVRAFFRIEHESSMQIDGGYLDLEVEHIDSDHMIGKVQTQLPKEFPLAAGDSLEIREDEILYKIEEREQ